MSEKNQQSYERYGAEWGEEMLKFPKLILIAKLRDALVKCQIMEHVTGMQIMQVIITDDPIAPDPTKN